MKTVYLSLGSNMGDRAAFLRQALEALNEPPRIIVKRVSPVYETEPQMVRDQNWFLNLVAEVETELFPLQLLTRICRIERQLGRKRLRDKGPRTIDIDIILYGNALVDTPELTIPHARFRERRFVLAPLADLAPDLRDPVTRKPIRQLLKDTADQEVQLRTAAL